jgi:hypothetical protein
MLTLSEPQGRQRPLTAKSTLEGEYEFKEACLRARYEQGFVGYHSKCAGHNPLNLRYLRALSGKHPARGKLSRILEA